MNGLVKLFRGSELPRLVLLAAIMIAGWSYVAWRTAVNPKIEPPKPPAAVSIPPLPPPDDSLEFHGIEDRVPLRPLENPAYATLLERARRTTRQELRAQSRRDVLFSQLIARPERYRGIPIHVEGTARRVIFQDVAGSKLFPKGRYYEAYVFTSDSQNFPYCLVFEDAPPNLSAGANIWEKVDFDGYFFKLMLYSAADKPRVAPLLVGRLSVIPPAAPVGITSIPLSRFVNGPTLALTCLSIYLMVRLAIQFYKMKHRQPKTGARLRAPVRANDYIAADELSAWIEEEAPEADEPDR